MLEMEISSAAHILQEMKLLRIVFVFTLNIFLEKIKKHRPPYFWEINVCGKRAVNSQKSPQVSRIPKFLAIYSVFLREHAKNVPEREREKMRVCIPSSQVYLTSFVFNFSAFFTKDIPKK